MNILVVGCGKVGSKLATALSAEGHDVSVVERDEQNLELLGPDFDGFTTLGIPIDQDVLKKAGIESCDALAAVSQDDNVNIMVSELAREIFHVKNVLARIYDPRREDVFSHFGLHTVCPTNLTVAAVRSALTERNKTQTVNFGAHTVNFITVEVTKNLIGTPLYELDFGEKQSLFAVIHADFTITVYQQQQIRLRTGDTLIVACLVD